MSRPPESMSPVARALANITGSCSCGTITVVTSRTRSVQAATAPRNVSDSGLSNAMRSPQHSDENGPSSMARAQSRSTVVSRSGSITGIVIPICTTAILACRRNALAAFPGGNMDRMVISSSSIAHVRLTVTNIERSRQFYESVFGWPVLLEVPDNADEATRGRLDFLSGGVVYDLGGALIWSAARRHRVFDKTASGWTTSRSAPAAKPN